MHRSIRFLALTALLFPLAAAADIAPPPAKPRIEVAFVLDTTGSMSGLIDGAKRKIWQIANQLASGKPTPEIRIDCPDDVKFEVARRVRDAFAADGHDLIDVDGVRVRFPHGWGLLRASNTQPVLVMRFEAESPARLAEYRATVERAVAAARSAVEGS